MAVKAGISKREFWHLTPKDVKLRFQAVSEQRENERKSRMYFSWMTGLYVKCAIASSFSSQNKYPENPLLSTDIHDVAKKTGKTEEELNGEKVLMTMLIMEANSRLSANSAD